MGSDDFFPEEAPAHQRTVGSFWIDAHPVTVADFRRFVTATGYVTIAERVPDPAVYPGARPADLVPGGLVFSRPTRAVPLDNWQLWWTYASGADWRHPLGPDSSVDGRQRHPVTQIGFPDALAYASWAGKELPTEAEWEYAARAGSDSAYSWGDEFAPRGRRMANTWQGRFPVEFIPGRGQRDDPGTTAVESYPPNAFGLYDMTGNVWEWTTDEYTATHRGSTTCCAPTRPDSASTDQPAPMPRHVIKGGSYLCAPNYCLRYRPAARQWQDEDTSTCHLGFRCIVRD